MKMSKYLNCPTYGCALSARAQECDPGTRQRGIVCTRLQDSEVHWALKVRVEWPVMGRLGNARTDTVSQVKVRRFAPRRVWESATNWVRRKEYSQNTPIGVFKHRECLPMPKHMLQRGDSKKRTLTRAGNFQLQLNWNWQGSILWMNLMMDRVNNKYRNAVLLVVLCL